MVPTLAGANVRWIAILAGLVLVAVASRPGHSEGARAEKVTIAVVGDSLADGMWGGLYRSVQKDKRYTIVRGAKNSVGFTGGDLLDMVDRAFASTEIHALVMMIGANDRRTVFVDGQPKALLGKPAWIEIYRSRVERFMDHAGKRNVPLVWLLLPIMRDANATREARVINAIVIDAARLRPYVFLIDTFRLTADATGAYVAHFADLSGQKRTMRAGDGVHFEQPAYELFAEMVLTRLREVSPPFARLAAE